MKKLLLISSFLLSAFILNAQTTKSFDFKLIKGVEAGYVYDVTLVNSQANKVVVNAPEKIIQYLDITQTEGVVKLSLKINEMPRSLRNNPGKIDAKVYLSKLESVDLSGAAKLVSIDKFSPNSFEIDLSGAANATVKSIQTKSVDSDISGASSLTLEIISDNAELELSGASKTVLTGNVKNLSIKVSGASAVKAEGCEINEVTAHLSGASSAKFSSIKVLSASTSGASSLVHSGDPIMKSKEISGGSVIKKINK